MSEKKEFFAQKLKDVLKGIPRMAIAFSGGLDSRFLCHAARMNECDILAIHAVGPHIPPAETSFARAWAEKLRLPYAEIALNPLSFSEVANNSQKRCYVCKKALFAKIKDFLTAKGEVERKLCDGGNRDDLNQFRPGLVAVREAGVLSPLAAADLGKSEIRKLARATGLDFPEQKARPCLLTRFAYGIAPDITTLEQLAKAENELESLLKQCGHEDVDLRIRILPEPELHLAKVGGITVEYGLQEKLLEILHKHSFENAVIRILADISGYFDKNKIMRNGAKI